MMTVSLCVIAYNEEAFLPNLLEDLLAQTYPHYLTEIVLVDGMSDDKTKKIMEKFVLNYKNDYIDIKVIDNKKRIQSAGWNLAIKYSTSNVIIRIDAHSHIPKEFTSLNMKLQESGEYITGGVRPCLIEEPNEWKKTLLEVENSLFGSSIASSRRSNVKKYVKSMFHAAYRREVFEKVGGFNESLLRTEDNEMHYRIREAGYKLYFDPSIVSYQYARSELKSMIKQKFGNGFWIGITLGVCPKCISTYHLIPFCFVLGIIITTILAMFGIKEFAIIMWGLYLFFTLLSVITVVRNKKNNKWTFIMPFLFLIFHINYGIGTTIGLAKMRSFLRKYKDNTYEFTK